MSLLAVAAITGQAVIQNAHADNLIDVYQKAVLHDARMASALGAYQAGVEKLPQGRSQLLPTVSFNSEKTYSSSVLAYDVGSPFQSGARDYEDLKYTTIITQPLFRKQNIAAYQQSKAQTAAAEEQLSFAKQDLMLRVAQAYFDLLSAQQILAAANANTVAMKAQDDKAKTQLSLGSGSRLEASESRAKYELARAREFAVRDDLVNKQQALRRITNEFPGTLDEPSPDFPLVHPDPNDVATWVKMAELAYPQLLALRYNVEAAQKEVERSQAGHYPTLDLVAQYSSGRSTGSAFTSAASDTEIRSAGIKLELPLYQGGLISSKAREAVGNLEKARGELEDAQREVVSQISQHFNGTINGIDLVLALEQALISSREASRANRIGLELGTRNQVDFLNAQQQVFDVARDLAKARQDYIMSRLRLMAYAGKLTEYELTALSTYLVPSPTKESAGAAPTEKTSSGRDGETRTSAPKTAPAQ